MKHKLEINSTKPFIIRFLESYHPLWKAKVNGKEYDPIPIYYENSQVRSQNIISTNYPGINGFIINETGKMTVTLENQPLGWVLHPGASFSSFALVLRRSLLNMAKKAYSFRITKKCSN